MQTIIRKVDENCIDETIMKEAGALLKQGALVAFPTETVYGLGANALDSEAAAKIYAAKGRPSDNPLIIHICKLDDIYKIVSDFPTQAQKLANEFWPGPLTMILKKQEWMLCLYRTISRLLKKVCLEAFISRLITHRINWFA